MSEREKIVLAYSGGLDTSVALRWMMEQYDADVIALLVDVGQPFEAEQVRRRAADAGAAEAIVDRRARGVRRATTACRRCRPAPCTRAAIRSRPRCRVR